MHRSSVALPIASLSPRVRPGLCERELLGGPDFVMRFLSGDLAAPGQPFRDNDFNALAEHPKVPGIICNVCTHRRSRKKGWGDGRRCALRAHRDRHGRPVLQAPILGTADSERRNCPGVRGVLSEVPEVSMSAGCFDALDSTNRAHHVMLRRAIEDMRACPCYARSPSPRCAAPARTSRAALRRFAGSQLGANSAMMSTAAAAR